MLVNLSETSTFKQRASYLYELRFSIPRKIRANSSNQIDCSTRNGGACTTRRVAAQPAPQSTPLAFALLLDEGDDVMHQRAVAGPGFGHRDPFVLGQAGRDNDVLVLNGTARRYGEFRRHGDDQVGWAELPALGPSGSSRQVGGGTFNGAVIHPLAEKPNLPSRPTRGA